MPHTIALQSSYTLSLHSYYARREVVLTKAKLMGSTAPLPEAIRAGQLHPPFAFQVGGHGNATTAMPCSTFTVS